MQEGSQALVIALPQAAAAPAHEQTQQSIAYTVGTQLHPFTLPVVERVTGCSPKCTSNVIPGEGT